MVRSVNSNQGAQPAKNNKIIVPERQFLDLKKFNKSKTKAKTPVHQIRGLPRARTSLAQLSLAQLVKFSL